MKQKSTITNPLELKDEPVLREMTVHDTAMLFYLLAVIAALSTLLFVLEATFDYMARKWK